jgi:hypothetical protein
VADISVVVIPVEVLEQKLSKKGLQPIVVVPIDVLEEQLVGDQKKVVSLDLQSTQLPQPQSSVFVEPLELNLHCQKSEQSSDPKDEDPLMTVSETHVKQEEEEEAFLTVFEEEPMQELETAEPQVLIKEEPVDE